MPVLEHDCKMETERWELKADIDKWRNTFFFFFLLSLILSSELCLLMPTYNEYHKTYGFHI